MKRFLFFGTMLFSISNLSACDCIQHSPAQKFDRFNFIFIARVTRILELHNNSKRPKKIEIEPIKIIKGLSSKRIINIDKLDGICPIPNPRLDEKWIFYLDKDFKLYSCNPSSETNGYDRKGIERDFLGIDVLRLLKSFKDIDDEEVRLDFAIENGEGKYDTTEGISKYLHSFKREEYKENVGLYLVKFKLDGFTVHEIEIVKSQGTKIDNTIKDYCFSNNFWKKQDNVEEKQSLRNYLIIPIVIRKPFWDNND